MNGRKRKANGGRGALLRVGEEGSGIVRPRWLMCSRTPVSRACSARCVVLCAAGREPIEEKESGDPGTRRTRPGVEFSICGEDGAGSLKRRQGFQPARGRGPSFSDRSVRGSGRAEFHQSRNLGERFDGGRPASSLEDRSPIEPHHSRQGRGSADRMQSLCDTSFCKNDRGRTNSLFTTSQRDIVRMATAAFDRRNPRSRTAGRAFDREGEVSRRCDRFVGV